MRTGLTDVFAGTICSVLTITYSLSYAALIFSGPLAHFLSYGIAVTFMSAAVGGAFVALRSSLPFAVAGPDSSISVVIAALVPTVPPRVAPPRAPCAQAGRRRQRRRSARAGHHRHGAGDGADRAVDVRAGLHPCRTRH